MTLADALQTAAEVYNPDDTIDLLGLLIIGLPGSLPAIAALIMVIRGQRKGKDRRAEDRAILDGVSKNVGVIKTEVKNDHPDTTNLRDDLDEIRNLVKDVSDRQVDQSRDIRGIRTDVGELRGADRDVRKDLTALERRTVAFARREHPGADPL